MAQVSLVMFAGYDSSSNSELWESNGTLAGTTELTGITGEATGMIFYGGQFVYGFNPSNFASLNGQVLFTGLNSSSHLGLWATNGTSAGTTELASGGGALNPSDLTVFNGQVLFNGNSNLWVSNGAVAGTHAVSGITGSSFGVLNPQDLTVFGNQVLFSGWDGVNQADLWVTNGVGAGTRQVTGIAGANSGGFDRSS